jgi:hypothetical protein
MKKSNARTGSKGSTQLPIRGGARKPADLAEIRRKITNRVGAEAATMVESTIEEVHKGHFAAMKYLFEMISLFPGAGVEERPEESSLAKVLLRRLGLPEDPGLENEVTKDREEPSVGKEGDAVE